jgi:hypothetical protein
MHRKSFINTHYIHFNYFRFLAVQPFAFKKYTDTSKFPFRALHIRYTAMARLPTRADYPEVFMGLLSTF